MPSRSPSPDTPASQSIPLQTLSRPPDSAGHSRQSSRLAGLGILHGRTGSILRGRQSQQYHRLDTDPNTIHANHPDDGVYSPNTASTFATAQIGLALDGSSEASAHYPGIPAIVTTAADEEPAYGDGDVRSVGPQSDENDLAPLAPRGLSKDITRGLSVSNSGQRHERVSKRNSVSFLDPTMSQIHRHSSSRLGDRLLTQSTDAVNRKSSVSGRSSRTSMETDGNHGRTRSISPSPSPFRRAGSIFREMSERVVNLSNDNDVVDLTIRRKSTQRERQPSHSERPNDDFEAGPEPVRIEAPAFTSPFEKDAVTSNLTPALPVVYANPLKGRSLYLFGPENRLRKWLLEVFTHSAAEPIILLLIVVQTVLLAVNAAANAAYNQHQTREWGSSSYDFAILGIFILYTFEAIGRSIISGFLFNAADYSTIDRRQGFRKGVVRKLDRLFASHDRPVSPNPEIPQHDEFQPSIVRSFTGLPDHTAPGHGRQQRRIRLARRAFLRHSFNRLDFIAVVSFWIAFGLQVSEVDIEKHVYVFNMLSTFRIVRLLSLTNGTTIILRSLKKAAPLLVNIAFLIGFFWLIFGIIGVQSFKSSFRRTCVWTGNDGSGQNYTLNVAPQNIQFCGGYLDNITGAQLPWVRADGSPGAHSPKGYLCPQQSICVEGPTNPYNNTMSFDNIIQSMELVFVIISSNTWSDIMYYLVASDYQITVLFFAVGIVVLALWLVNLLIAVITSSFQVIREESNRSAFTNKEIEQDSISEDPVPRSTRTSQFRQIVKRSEPLWIFIITFDIVTMCLRSSSMSDVRRDFINDTETVVTLLLLLEILLRLACDWRSFFRGKRNNIDFALALITAVIQVPPIRNSGEAYAWLTFFQIARIYRVVMFVPLTRDLIMVVFGNAVGILNLIVFVILFTFLASIMASQLFRGDIPAQDSSGNYIQIQFSNIWNSFTGMYIIFSSENWTTIMYNITQFDLSWNTAWLGAAFIIMWFIISNLIILNMFIAVIQESFDVSEDEKRLQQIKQFLKQQEAQSTTSGGNLTISSIFKGNQDARHREGKGDLDQLLKDAVVTDFLDSEAQNGQHSAHAPRPTSRPLSAHLTSLPNANIEVPFLKRVWQKISGYNKHDPNPFYAHESVLRANEEFDAKAVAKQVSALNENRRRAQRQYLNRHPRYNVSLFIFKVNNPVRKLCQSIVGPSRGSERPEGVEPNKFAWYAFSAFTYACIVAMVAIACVATPLYQKQTFSATDLHDNWLVWADLGFAVIFSLEALIKIIADGFFYTPNAFFRSVWGLIDVVVLVSLWVSVTTTLMQDDSITRGVGALKALRALRLLNISDSARNTFNSVIIVGGYKVLSAAFVSLSLLVPFAVLGVNLFNGTFQSCNNYQNGFHGDLQNCVGEYNSTPFNNNWPVLAPQVVANPWYSFDNFGSSLFILFQIVSQEGWVNVLQSGMNVVGVGQQPLYFNRPGNAVFFIVFNLLGTVFVLTLFISVFMRNYTEQTGVAFLTADQRSWLELRKLLRQIRPTKRSIEESTSGIRRQAYELVFRRKQLWPRLVTVVLLAHLTLLVIEFYPEPDWWDRTRDIIFLCFTLILMANVVVRMVGLSWKRFASSSWDLYSLFAVPGTLATSFIALFQLDNKAFDQLHKLFLVSVAFLLIPRNNQLDQLFKTAAASFHLIANLLATWFVLFLVFAIALTQAFSLTRFGPNESPFINFRDVPRALILLFRMSIGEGWNQIMQDYAAIQSPFCVNGDTFFDGDCGSDGWARGLLVAWNLISMYIFTSLFVSLIFESFSYVYQRSGGLSVVSRDEIRNFKAAWAEFDPNGTGYISIEEFPRLLGELSGCFQMRIYDGDFTVQNLKEDCKVELGENTRDRNIVAGIDLTLLRARLNQIPVGEIRARRLQMNLFYHEMLISADPVRGISFTHCLMTLTHYNVISDSQSLRLEEFLRRKAKLQRVNDSIQRDIVRHFILTVRLRKRFKKHQERKRDSTVAGPLDLGIPEIYVEGIDEDEELAEEREPHDFTEVMPLSPQRNGKGRASRPSISIDTSNLVSYSDRFDNGSLSPSPVSSPVNGRSSQHLGATEADSGTSGRLSVSSRPSLGERPSVGSRRSVVAADRMSPTTPTLGGHSRQSSAVSNLNVNAGVAEMFDASAWGESLRRNFTQRRSAV